MPAFVKSSVGSSAGISDEEGTRRCPRSSKKRRNRSLTSVDFIPAPDNLRNPIRRKTAAGQRIEDAPAPQRRREMRARLPQSLERAAQGLVFPLGRSLALEGRGDRVAREAARLQLALDAGPPVTCPAHPHRGSRGREVV